MDTDYIKSIRTAVGTAADLAHFVGVSHDTVDSWCAGRRVPGPVVQRLLYVLGLLLVESPALFNAVTQTRTVYKSSKAAPGRKPITGPFWSPGTLPVVTDELRAMLRESEREMLLPDVPAPLPRKKPGKRDDSFWFERSVESYDAWVDGEEPAVRVRVAELRRMTDAQEHQFWDEAKAYERRTGRFVPEAED